MAKDPVCGTSIDEKTTKFRSRYTDAYYNIKTYYFCSETCKATFDNERTKT